MDPRTIVVICIVLGMVLWLMHEITNAPLIDDWDDSEDSERIATMRERDATGKLERSET